MKRKILVCALLVAMMTMSACANTGTESSTSKTTSSVSSSAGDESKNEDSSKEESKTESEVSKTDSTEISTTLSKIDMTKWQYNSDNDIYWQVGISYCANPANASYETMGIYVPGGYLKGTENGDGTYTCELNSESKVGNYTASTAPIVFPVNTPGYSAMNAPAGYSDVSAYTSQGFVYMHAGCRGRDDGAPAGVTDLKAAVRYLRYNEGTIPGSMDRIFSFGMSGGGAQSALMGTTGDSDLYTPYLKALGAVEGVSDSVAGSMCWCPITNLDVADAAYEWNLGSARSGLDDDTQKLSDSLAEKFAEYINALGLKDSDGNTLTLEKSDNGVYQSGSYYDYIKTTIETSLNYFIADTAFPYTASSTGGMGGGFGGEMPSGERPDGSMPESGFPDGSIPDGAGPDSTSTGTSESSVDYTQIDNVNRTETTSGLSLSGTYETVQDYIDALNANGEWVSYDSDKNTVTITGVSDFVAALKSPSKSVGAFDALDRSQAENTLFGYADGSGAHFDYIEAELLAGTDYEAAFTEDLAKTDAQSYTPEKRVAMYNPMYYLCDYYDGNGTSTVAKYFRIRTGINQGDTALCTEVDLALALAAKGSTVDFETVWGQGHTQAERSGDSETNFIAWVNECLK